MFIDSGGVVLGYDAVFARFLENSQLLSRRNFDFRWRKVRFDCSLILIFLRGGARVEDRVRQSVSIAEVFLLGMIQ